MQKGGPLYAHRRWAPHRHRSTSGTGKRHGGRPLLVVVGAGLSEEEGTFVGVSVGKHDSAIAAARAQMAIPMAAFARRSTGLGSAMPSRLPTC